MKQQLAGLSLSPAIDIELIVELIMAVSWQQPFSPLLLLC
jgi:hypothetical protein